MKTANLAIVFTDIQGFTERTSRQTLEQNRRLLKTHNDLLVPIFKAFGGRVIKSIGDAFLVTFESPTQAVLAGMAMQDRLWQYNRGALDAERLDVRVAINVGEVRLESNDVFGEPVNIASRVEGLAEAGEVFFTEAVYLAMNKAEVPSQEVGFFELKGIPGKIRVFRVPRAPYRVETPQVVHLEAGAPVEPEQPPFGNLALSRVPEPSRGSGAGLSASAAQMGERLARGTRTVFSSVSLPGSGRLSPWLLGMGVAVGVLLLVGLGVLLRASPAESAVNDVLRAPPAERPPLADVAHRRISEEKLPAGQGYLMHGRVDEAVGAFPQALRNYRAALKNNEPDGLERIVGMLKHPECAARSAAADVLGELRQPTTRGALERLSREGGADDSSGFLGCNSRKAAQRALEKLGR